MNKKIALFALLSLITIQTNYISAADHSLPSTNLRVIGLTGAASFILYFAVTTLKTILDKTLEENPTISEETLRSKCITALRYTFGISASVAGIIFSLYTLSNVDNADFFNKLC